MFLGHDMDKLTRNSRGGINESDSRPGNFLQDRQEESIQRRISPSGFPMRPVSGENYQPIQKTHWICMGNLLQDCAGKIEICRK